MERSLFSLLYSYTVQPPHGIVTLNKMRSEEEKENLR